MYELTLFTTAQLDEVCVYYNGATINAAVEKPACAEGGDGPQKITLLRKMCELPNMCVCVCVCVCVV